MGNQIKIITKKKKKKTILMSSNLICVPAGGSPWGVGSAGAERRATPCSGVGALRGPIAATSQSG